MFDDRWYLEEPEDEYEEYEKRCEWEEEESDRVMVDELLRRT